MPSLNNPIVSVVMPIYNHSEKQLTTAIHSILNQTFHDLELIVVDGKSGNKNTDIISSISDPRIKYYKTKGYINCLNFGIEQSKGKYIARMDSDDISHPARIEEQVRFLDKNPEISLCSCLVEYFGDYTSSKFSEHTNDINNLIDLIKQQQFVHTAMMFRKHINIHYDNLKPLEDCLLFRRLLLDSHKFAIIDKVLMKSYHSNNSIMARRPKLMAYYISKINIFALTKYYNYNLSFADEIFSKKRFSKDEIIDFLKLLCSIKNNLKQHDLDINKIAHPYFLHIIQKSKHKCFLLKSKSFYQTFFRLYLNIFYKKFIKNIIRSIFSIRNEYYDDIKTKENKQKVLCILGLKFKLHLKKQSLSKNHFS